MAKPKNVIPTIEKKLQIAADLCARMELELFSDVEGKIPYGAQSELINKLLRRHYQAVDNAAVFKASMPASPIVSILPKE